MTDESLKIEELLTAFKELSDEDKEKALALMQWIKDKRSNDWDWIHKNVDMKHSPMQSMFPEGQDKETVI